MDTICDTENINEEDTNAVYLHVFVVEIEYWYSPSPVEGQGRPLRDLYFNIGSQE